MQLDKHFLIERPRPCFRRECLVYPALACMGVYRFPDRLAGLAIFGQAMPICTGALVHPLVGRTQNDLVFAPASMCNFHGAAVLNFCQVLPQWRLIPAHTASVDHFGLDSITVWNVIAVPSGFAWVRSSLSP